MSVRLVVTYRNGTQEEVEFQQWSPGIELAANRIVNIDLTGLSSCTNLEFLRLEYNDLKHIDLSPLSSCESLKRLWLHGNQYQSIDLSALSSCSNLEELILAENQVQLEGLDLTPLSSCSSIKKIVLHENHLKSIDLTPLSSCSNLEELHIGGNQFQSIDLSTLSSCTNFKELSLDGNQLQSIDLFPLGSCVGLQTLRLQGNQIQSIDLTPLNSCTNLEMLWLGENQLQTIDLFPLGHCPNLHVFGLEGNQLQSIDLSPLSLRRIMIDLYENQLQFIDTTPLKERSSVGADDLVIIYSWIKNRGALSAVYERPKYPLSWSFLHQLTCTNANDTRIQQDLLVALGLGAYGFIDSDLQDILSSFPSDSSNDKVRKSLAVSLVDMILDSVDKGGSTTGLLIDEVAMQHAEIAKIAPTILRLRDSEIQKVRIEHDGNEVDLRELWATAYGYEILSALDVRLITDSAGLEPVRNAFRELGYEVNIGKSSRSGVNMRESLKNAIWWIAENRGR